MLVYTVITNNYDTLREPEYITPGWDYVLFSDKYIESDVWECAVTDKPNREIKILGHREMFRKPCLYVDGSIRIIGDLNEFTRSIPNWFTAWKHQHRDCVYEEGEAVVRLKRIDPDRVKLQLDRYRSNGFPEKWGLAACGVLFRDFSDPVVRGICNEWWNEFERGVPRDQLGLPYVMWRRGCVS